MTTHLTDRRSFLCTSAALLPLARATAAPDRAPLKVAAIFTEFTHRSHAHVFMENFLEPYLFNGKITEPGVRVVSFYCDQFPANDMARGVGKDYQIPLFATIDGALCLGDKDLAVDAVLSIAEQGNYPVNAKGAREYPRKRFFDEIIAVFRRSGRVVPVFNDKHFSYRWNWAKEMFDTAAAMKIPLMAGSSVPLAERRPPLELLPGAKIAEAVSIHSGGFESYDFHALEILQSMVEARAGGETGVDRVQYLGGDSLWKAADDGLWSPKLADAAMAAELGPGQPTLRELVKIPPFNRGAPFGILVQYRDGLKGLSLKVSGTTPTDMAKRVSANRWNFACQLAGEREPRAAAFYVGPWNNRNLFKALSHAIQNFIRTGKSPYPVERTLLTTGVLAAAVDSKADGGKTLDTPHLRLAYQPRDYKAYREMGESWKIITEEIPEPRGITSGGHRGK